MEIKRQVTVSDEENICKRHYKKEEEAYYWILYINTEHGLQNAYLEQGPQS